MKARFYIDLWPGIDPLRYPLMCTQAPGEKHTNVIRIAFDVTIPDHLIYREDHHAPEVSPVVVVE